MNILKKIALIIVVLLGLYILVSLFLPSTIKIERSITISSKASHVFEQINNLKNWKHWSYWDNIDPDMISDYSGPESGVGAKHCWESKNDSVGKGCLTISEIKENRSIITTLEFEGMGSSIGGWQIDDTTGGVNVSTYMDLDMGLWGRIFPGLMMDSWLGCDFEKSLNNLKTHCEKLALKSVQKKEIKIELTTTPPQLLATYRMVTNLQTISNDIGTSYGKIIQYIQKNKLTQTAPVLAFYHSFSPEKIDLECAIPVDKKAKSESGIAVIDFPSSHVVVAHYYGEYKGSEAAHLAIDKWIKDKNMIITGSPWEVYVTDPFLEKDTSKWLTDVYYPVK